MCRGGGAVTGSGAVIENSTLVALLVGVFIVVGALLVAARRSVRTWGRRLGSRVGLIAGPAAEAAPDSPTAGGAAAAADASTDASGETAPSMSPFDRAQTALSAGQPDDAVRIAYAAMRSRLQPPEAETEATHWEFYRHWQENATVDRTQLRTVTEAYETATFAPDSVPSDTAADAVTASDELAGQHDRTAD